MKKLPALLLGLAGFCLLAACGSGAPIPEPVAEESHEVWMEITVTAGDKRLIGVLFDNDTARAFAQLLPLDVPLWNPAPGFARAFELEEQLPDPVASTRSYALGGLAYWHEGPSVAIFYSDHLKETLVPVVTIGRIEDDVRFLAEYDQPVQIAAAEKPEGEESLATGVSKEERSGDTVLTATADPRNRQVLYLWEEGNVPAVTTYTVNDRDYFDGPDFRPTVTSFPVAPGTPVKGAVLICAGGAFQFRSDENEGTPVAEVLSALGYQSFVVDYRLRPYTQQEGAVDLARAVRFVRKNAGAYGIDPDDIAVMGFSAGGILAGEMLLNFDGTVSPSALDPGYLPDELDAVSADAAADGMIYSFYGRLSVGSTDVELLRAGNLPPTFYCYGTRDPFYEQFLANADAAEAAGVTVERLQLDGMPHGFGSQGVWIDGYDRFLSRIFAGSQPVNPLTKDLE